MTLATFNVGDRVYFGRGNGEQTLGEVVKVNRAKLKVKQIEARGTMRAYAVGTIWTVPPSLCKLAGANATPAAPVAPAPLPTATDKAAEALWTAYAPGFGLPVDAFGKTFKAGRMEYRITGIAPNRRQYPVTALRVRDGREFKFTADMVKTALSPSAAPGPVSVPRFSVGTPVTIKGWQGDDVVVLITHVGRDAYEVYGYSRYGNNRTVLFDEARPAAKRTDDTILDEITGVYCRLEPENLSCDGERTRSEMNRVAAALNRALKALFRELGRQVTASEAFARDMAKQRTA
jgi:hypothetical protein